MVETASTGIDMLRGEVTGKVILPGEEGYDEARSVWNGWIDRRPAVIVRCLNAKDIAAALKYARGQSLEVSVRGGGHNFSGNAVCDGGMMIHLGDMNSVAVDPDRRRAIVSGGATWGDVDAATQAHALAVPGGFISHTGVAGLTLGGGIGWLSKLHGLSLDNVVGAEVVTPASEILHASATENPDLFWALRGGGGNFGIVSTFELQLHPIGPMVNVGLLFWEIERGHEALRVCREITARAPIGR